MSYYKPGDHNAICSTCGFQFKFSQLRKDWQNRYQCNKCWEPRHPQDLVRGVKDDQSVRVALPPPTDTFVAETTWDDTLKQWV